MEVTQTIQLENNEKEILEKAFSLMEEIGDELRIVDLGDVFAHLIEHSVVTSVHTFILDNPIDVSDL